MALYTSVLTAGTNSHQTTAEEANLFTTNFVTPGVAGSITNTAGIAPMTGPYAVNAQVSVNKTVTITAAGQNAYVQATPVGQGNQVLAIRGTADIIQTLSDNTSGGTRYDWIYLAINPTNANNPSTDGSNVASITVSRSTSNVTDTGTPPTYAQLLAVVTLVNGFSAVTNSNIADRRTAASTALVDNSVTAAKLSSSAITLGFAQLTTSFSTTSTSPVLIANGGGTLSATVTIPPGGRKIKITAYAPELYPTGGYARVTMAIWDGTIGASQITRAVTDIGTSGNQLSTITAIAVITPAAGTKTYNVSLATASGTGNLGCGGNVPAFLLVEAI